MANYAHVENDQITGVYDSLPENWRNVSNFYALQGDTQTLESLGWFEIDKVVPEIDPSNQVLGPATHEIVNGRVVETYSVIDVLPPEPPAPLSADDQWVLIRSQRDQLMDAFEWRYTRYARQQRLGLETTDDIQSLDAYMQALADITTQQDPFDIVWPEVPLST